MWINGEEKVTLDLTETGDARGFPVESGKYAGIMWVRFLDGTQTAADTYLRTHFASDPKRPIRETDIWRGVPLAIVTTKLKGKGSAWGGGVPKFVFEIWGIPLYDISKDSTAGGSGSHRWSNPATWEPSDNPAVQIYNLLRGIWYDGVWLHGGQTLTANRLPSANWIAAINACNALVDTADEGTEKAYRSSLECFTNEEPLALIEECLAACAGRLIDAGGVYKIKVGAPGSAVFTFTDDDVIVTDPQDLDPFPSLDETVNGVIATFPNPDEAWENVPAPALHDAAMEALDKDRRLPADVNFNAVPHAEQVQRLMSSMLADNRRFAVHVLTLPPDAYVLEPGDVVAWTSARNGYSAKDFEVKQTELLPNANISVVVREVDAADFDHDAEDIIVQPGQDTDPTTEPVQVMSGWQVAGSSLDNARPTLAVTFAADVDDTAAVEIEARDTATQTVMFSGTIPYGDVGADGTTRTVKLNGVFQHDTSYDARGRFVPVGNREASFGSWLTATTPDLRQSLDDLADEVIERFDEIESDALANVSDTVQRLRDAEQRIQQLDQEIANAGIQQSLNIRRVAEELPGKASVSVTDTLAATIEEQGDTLFLQGAAITAVEAELPNKASVATTDALLDTITAQGDDITVQGAAITAVEAELPNKASTSALSALSNTVSDQGGQISTLSTSLTAIEAKANDATASGTYGITVQTGVGGTLARFATTLSITAGGTEYDAGEYLELWDDGGTVRSRKVTNVNQWVVTDGSGNSANAMVWDVNGLRLNVAHIGTVTAGTLQSQNGAMTIDLNAGTIDIVHTV